MTIKTRILCQIASYKAFETHFTDLTSVGFYNSLRAHVTHLSYFTFPTANAGNFIMRKQKVN